MKATLPLACLLAIASARTVTFGFTERGLRIRHAKREVPQEHSHQNILDIVQISLVLNNPDGILDSVFGLLGAKAAATGAGKIADPDCLQQATADQAFSNAKAAKDVAGQTAALIYRALERNSGSVGGLSPNCTTITAVNAEIAALTQHQDPASDGAAAFNKNVVLTLAAQIASIGGNAQDALKSGTFAPGTIGDPTAKGNTCDDANDPNGCINTLKLLVPDASADEIDAAVSGASNGSADVAAAPAASNSTVLPSQNGTAAATGKGGSAAGASKGKGKGKDKVKGKGKAKGKGKGKNNKSKNNNDVTIIKAEVSESIKVS